MVSEGDIYALVERVKAFLALTDPAELWNYAYLVAYVLLNAVLVTYRKTLSIGAIVYLLILGIMYAVSFFWEGMPSIFLWLYGGAAFYAIFIESRRVLTPFVLMNIFNCLVVIPNAAGGPGALSLDMFFEDPIPAPLVQTFWDLNGMAQTFLLLFCPVFIAVEVHFFWRRRRALKKAQEAREALLARKVNDPNSL